MKKHKLQCCFFSLCRHEKQGCDLPELLLMRRASGYEGGTGPLSDGRGAGTGHLQPAPPIYMPILTGGGSMYSTVEDMQRWDASVLSWVMLADNFYHKLLLAFAKTRWGQERTI